VAGLVGRRLVSAEQETAVFRRLIAERRTEIGRRCRRGGTRFHRLKAELPGDFLQLPDDDPKGEHDGPGASKNCTDQEQRIAETEFLDRQAKQNRQRTRQHKDDPNAGDLLGQVFRHLWHLSWRDEKPEKRKEKAIETSQQAALAVRSFIQAQQFDPSAYFAGFNALILIALLKDLRQSMGCDLSEIWPADVDEAELATVVEFCAKNFREQAIEKGDPVEQFWTTTTLAGLALIRNDNAKALQRVREACSIPGATFFQLRSFQERLLLHGVRTFGDDLRRHLAGLNTIVYPDPLGEVSRIGGCEGKGGQVKSAGLGSTVVAARAVFTGKCKCAFGRSGTQRRDRREQQANNPPASIALNA